MVCMCVIFCFVFFNNNCAKIKLFDCSDYKFRLVFGLVKDMTFVVMRDLIIAILLSSAENYYCYLFVFCVRFHAHMYLLIRGSNNVICRVRYIDIGMGAVLMVCLYFLLLLFSLVFSSTNNLAKIKLFDLSEY
jgi:hypothetical protein